MIALTLAEDKSFVMITYIMIKVMLKREVHYQWVLKWTESTETEVNATLFWKILLSVMNKNWKDKWEIDEVHL